ncbi:MAG: hypothetical protein ACRCXB_12270 [Aeromonadaceae bacterium]
MKISKSKQELARIISENGGWRDGNYAIQDKDDLSVWFTHKVEGKPCGNPYWPCHKSNAISHHSLLPNWHQTILSREEYLHLHHAPDADGWIEWRGGKCPVEDDRLVLLRLRDGYDGNPPLCARNFRWSHKGDNSDIIAYRLHKSEQAELQYCESVTRSIPEPATKPTLDQLLQDWRNADDYAQRKQTEADEAAAMRDERWKAVQARAGEVGVTVGRCDPVVIGEQELVITDYHHLHIGDILRCKSVPSGAKCRVGDEGVLVRTESAPLAGGVYVDVCGRDWFGVFGEHWEFIRRP